MRQFIARRLLTLVPVMLIAATIVFLLVHFIPGDPAAMILGEDARPEEIEQLRRELGLDRPAYAQYFTWLGNAVVGNFGNSLYFDRPVLGVLVARLEPTMTLSLFAGLFAVCLGIPLGVVAALRHGTGVDQSAMTFSLFGVSIPNFWLGMNFILLFSVTLRWLPSTGFKGIADGPWEMARYMIMPIIVLGLSQAALIARMTRANMLEVLRQDYVRTARSKGVNERVVIFKHALRNAMIPTVTVIGLVVGNLLSGSAVTETIFAIPGVGRLMVVSIARRDFPIIQGGIMLIAGFRVLVNLLVDVSYVIIDPRIRYS